MRLIDANELKNENSVFAIMADDEHEKAMFEKYNEIIDHFPTFDLEKHDAEIRNKTIEKFVNTLLDAEQNEEFVYNIKKIAEQIKGETE